MHFVIANDGSNLKDPPGCCHKGSVGRTGTPARLMKLSISRPDNLVVSWLVVVFCRYTTSLLSNLPCLYTLHMQQSVSALSQYYTRPFHYVTEQDKIVSIHILSYTCTSSSLSFYSTALVSPLNRNKGANKYSGAVVSLSKTGIMRTVYCVLE
jgi:hypothetical protein